MSLLLQFLRRSFHELVVECRTKLKKPSFQFLSIFFCCFFIWINQIHKAKFHQVTKFLRNKKSLHLIEVINTKIVEKSRRKLPFTIIVAAMQYSYYSYIQAICGHTLQGHLSANPVQSARSLYGFLVMLYGFYTGV